MITEFQIKNFRSIKDQTIPVKKLNILYGPNGSGKSSVLYAPYVMRNFFVNPNQKLNSLFNLGFINLGNIENIENKNGFIQLSIQSEIPTSPWLKFIKYHLNLTEVDFIGPEIAFETEVGIKNIQIDIPYTSIQKEEVEILGNKFLWNGLTFEDKQQALDRKVYGFQLNRIYQDIKSLEMISVKRGFFSPIFSSEFNPDEASFALQIREDLDFELKIDKYFNSIFDKNFRFVAIPGSTSF
jgi:AAA15 family ATPase/GTPase